MRKALIEHTANEWIGFWSGYLGALFGGLITLYVMYKTNELSCEHFEIMKGYIPQIETVEYYNDTKYYSPPVRR